MCMSFAELARGNAHRRYLYGYLSELRELHPSWAVGITGSPGTKEYVYVRTDDRTEDPVMVPLQPGREYLAIRALRKAMRGEE